MDGKNGRNENLIAARRFHHHQHSNVDSVKKEIWVNTNIMPCVSFPKRKFQESGFPKGCTVEKRGCNGLRFKARCQDAKTGKLHGKKERSVILKLNHSPKNEGLGTLHKKEVSWFK